MCFLSADKQSRFSETGNFTHLPITFRLLPRQEYTSSKRYKKKKRFPGKSSVDPENCGKDVGVWHDFINNPWASAHDVSSQNY
jgi:hypothetical protein